MSELIKKFTLLEAESIGPFRSGLRENRTQPSCVQTATSAPFNSTKFTLRNRGKVSKVLPTAPIDQQRVWVGFLPFEGEIARAFTIVFRFPLCILGASSPPLWHYLAFECFNWSAITEWDVFFFIFSKYLKISFWFKTPEACFWEAVEHPQGWPVPPAPEKSGCPPSPPASDVLLGMTVSSGKLWNILNVHCEP